MVWADGRQKSLIFQREINKIRVQPFKESGREQMHAIPQVELDRSMFEGSSFDGFTLAEPDFDIP
jgi:hypothetical protein